MFSFKQPPLFCGEKGETFTFWKGICVGDLEFLHAGLAELWCPVKWSWDVLYPGSVAHAGTWCALGGKNRLWLFRMSQGDIWRRWVG